MIKPIQTSITAHDQTQLQTVFNYKLLTKEGGHSPKVQSYTVDAFLFFPPQLAINHKTYSKDDFYEDIRPYLRFNAPKYTYNEFLGKKNRKKQKVYSPYSRIKTLLRQIKKGQAFSADDAIREVHFFACVFHKFIAERADRRCKKILAGYEHSVDLTLEFNITESFMKRGHKILKAWYELTEAFQVKDEKTAQMAQEMLYAGEYCFFVFLEGMTSFGHAIRHFKETSDVLLFKRKIRALSRLYHHVALRRGFQLVDKDSTMKDLENFSLHMRGLKRRMWQVLFLDVEQTKTVVVKQQLAYMVAAGFSAIWALMANLFIWRELQFTGYQTKGAADSFLGYGGAVIAVAFIVAYVLQDRIKEIGRNRFLGRVFKRADTNKHIWYHTSESDRKSVGTIEERTSFLSRSHPLRQEIEKYRKTQMSTNTAFDEKMIHYQKKINFSEKNLRESPYPLVAVRDIIRLNVNRYVARMDDPTKEFIMMTSMGEVRKIQIPKVYNIDMVLKYTYKEDSDSLEKTFLETKRLILNKNGLVRVE